MTHISQNCLLIFCGGGREQARPAVWGTPQYSDLWQRALSVGERQEAAQGALLPFAAGLG